MGEISQAMKCLWPEHEGLHSVLSSHGRKLSTVLCLQDPSAGEAEILWGSLAIQPCPTEPQVSLRNPSGSEAPEEQVFQLPSLLLSQNTMTGNLGKTAFSWV